jgi:cytochrome c peroxidase
MLQTLIFNFRSSLIICSIFLVLIVSLISACAAVQQGSGSETEKTTGEQLSTLHRWDDRELSLMKNLWIGNLLMTPPDSERNRVADNPEAISFGHKLFFDKRFSGNGQVACASCHKPELYFTDGLQMAQGMGTVTRNAPTIVGASFNHWFFHDGRADSLWSQALGPLENELEHGGNRSRYVHLVYEDAELRNSYEKLFGTLPDLSDKKRFPSNAGPVGDAQANSAWQDMSEMDRKSITDVFVNLGKVIAAYERQIKPAPSRFDVYVKAVLDNDAGAIANTLSDAEVAGLRLFITKAQCAICHTGPMFTDFEFHNIRTVTMPVKTPDLGRYNGARQVLESEFNCRSEYNDAADKSCPELKFIVTAKHDTVAAFKTPSLRNVSKTAPYMHAGQYQALSEVLKHYNDPPKQIIGESDLLFISLTETELSQLEAFLLCLDSPIAADPALLSPPS